MSDVWFVVAGFTGILGGLTVYAATELRKPGWNSSVTAAPPTTARRSRTLTLRPARAR